MPSRMRACPLTHKASIASMRRMNFPFPRVLALVTGLVRRLELTAIAAAATACGHAVSKAEPRATQTNSSEPYLVATLPTTRLMDLEKKGEHIFVSGMNEKRVYRFDLHAPDTSLVSVVEVDKLAADIGFEGDDMYIMSFAAYADFTLYRGSGHGPAIPVLSGAPASTSFVLTPEEIFWLSYVDAAGQLWRRRRTGGTPELLATLPSTAHYSAGLLLTSQGDFLCVNQGDPFVYRIPRSGGTPTIAFDLGSKSGGALVEDDDAYYVATYMGKSVLRLDKETGEISTVAHGPSTAGSPTGLAVDETTIYWSNYFSHDVWAVKKRNR